MRAHLLNAFLALVFSVLIWSAVGAQLSEDTSVELDYVVQVPPDVTVTYLGRHSAGELKIPIKVDVRGPREVVTRLAKTDVSARKTFTHEHTFLREALAAGGIRTLELSTSDVFVTRPGVEVVATRPPQLDLAFSQVEEWESNVLNPQIVGTPAPGFKVAAVRVDLSRVRVRGPASIHQRQPGPYEVEAVDVTGERVRPGERVYPLTVDRAMKTPLGVTCDARVQVIVTIVPEPELRELSFPVRVILTPRRPGASSSVVEPLDVAVEPRPPVQEWYWSIPLRGAAADLEALSQRLDQERRSPGSVKSLPVAYVRFDNLPPAGLVDDLDVVVMGLPEGVTVETVGVKKFPIRTVAVERENEPGTPR
jgi:hypothetical protein